MKDYNCFIYIPKEKLEQAKFYLSLRNINFVTKKFSNTIIEIGAEEKNSLILDRLSKRCNN